jgi:hypothetical protein
MSIFIPDFKHHPPGSPAALREFDALGMMQQVGAIPSPGQPLAAPATGHAAQNTRISDGVGSNLR